MIGLWVARMSRIDEIMQAERYMSQIDDTKELLDRIRGELKNEVRGITIAILENNDPKLARRLNRMLAKIDELVSAINKILRSK